MRKPDKFLLTLVIAMCLVSISACSGKTTPQPITSPKTPTRTKKPVSTKTPANTIAPLPVAPSPIQTNTTLPAIPAIGDVISFGTGGGGGGICYRDSNAKVEIFGVMPCWGANYNANYACICLRGLKFDTWYEIQVVSPNGQRTLRGDVEISETDQEISFIWPLGVSDGIWRIISVAPDGSRIEGFLEVDPNSKISIQDSKIPSDLILLDSSGKWLDIDSIENGITIQGEKFLPNSQVMIFVYEHIENDAYVLTSKDDSQTDSQGDLGITITMDIKPGKTYKILGVQIPVEDSTRMYNAPNVSFTANCPSAPPQRMVVNQPGYVCTKGDNVRLRNAPNRSGSAIDSLQVGTQFTVLDGPSCADNWSWWRIRMNYGATGWIAEGGDNVDPYFICPLP